MTEQRNARDTDERMDHRLRELFPSRPELEGDFEQRVMARLEAIPARSTRQRGISLIMTGYWVLFGLFAGWVIADVLSHDSGASSLGLGVLALAMALVITSALLLVRQSRLKISQLFFRTVI